MHHILLIFDNPKGLVWFGLLRKPWTCWILCLSSSTDPMDTVTILRPVHVLAQDAGSFLLQLGVTKSIETNYWLHSLTTSYNMKSDKTTSWMCALVGTVDGSLWNSPRTAVELLGSMKHHGIDLDAVAFNAAMKAAVAEGHSDQALQLMRGMAQVGVQPSLVSYGTAMLASNHLGRWEAG